MVVLKMNDWTGKSGYVAAGVIVGVSNLTPNQWYMLIGVLLGVATLGVNIYYKQKTKVHQDKLRQLHGEQDKDESQSD